MNPDIKISDAELEIMRILWREAEPIKAATLCDELLEAKGWSRSTTNTLITRLRDKNLIEPAERYGVARYIPLVSEYDYILAEEKTLLGRVGSAKKLAIAMVRNNHLTTDDIDELKGLFSPCEELSPSMCEDKKSRKDMVP